VTLCGLRLSEFVGSDRGRQPWAEVEGGALKVSGCAVADRLELALRASLREQRSDGFEIIGRSDETIEGRVEAT
jgi:hypothetical protein